METFKRIQMKFEGGRLVEYEKEFTRAELDGLARVREKRIEAYRQKQVEIKGDVEKETPSIPIEKETPSIPIEKETPSIPIEKETPPIPIEKGKDKLKERKKE